MNEVTLYADSPTEHEAQRAARPFAETVALIRRGATTTLSPTPTNLWRLGRLARFALSLQGRAAELPDFQPQDHLKLGGPWHDYLARLQCLLREEPLLLGPAQPELAELLDAYDAAVNADNHANLLRLLGALTDGCFIGPHTFHLDISNTCNTNCLFCGLHSPLLVDPKNPTRGRRFTEGWKNRKLDWPIFEQLVEDLAAIGTREDILFTGEGEPFTHPDLPRMVRLVKGKELGLTVFTNGLLLDEQAAALFVEVDLDILYWSLSAASPQTFAKLQPAHGPERFAPLVGNFAELVKRKRQKNNKPYLIQAHVINRLNAHECEAAMDLAIETGVDAVRYQVMHQAGDGMGHLLITAEQFHDVKQQLARARRKAEEHEVDIVANIDFQLERVADTFAKPDLEPYFWSHDLYNRTGCLAGWFFARNFTDGRLSFCCHDKVVGSLYRGLFRDIWFSERYRKLRQAAKAFAAEVNPELTDESSGGPLLGPDCAYCGNYEFINRALADLDRLALHHLLRREPPAWP